MRLPQSALRSIETQQGTGPLDGVDRPREAVGGRIDGAQEAGRQTRVRAEETAQVVGACIGIVGQASELQRDIRRRRKVVRLIQLGS